MIGPSLQVNELDSFKMANSLLAGPVMNPDETFEAVLERQEKEVAKKVDEKASDIVNESNGTKKKKGKENLSEGLPNITGIVQNIERRNSREIQNTYLLLERFRENKKSQEDDLLKSPRQQVFSNAYNVAGQALIQPIYDQGQRRMTKSQILEQWEKFTPVVTEDVTKKAVRLDIPLVNDVQALVLRIHPDKSISASLLGSKAMEELIKQNKDKLDRNLRHHHLSLREFNTYRSELEFTNDSGTKKRKKQSALKSRKGIDLI